MNVPDIEVHEATSLAEASSLMTRYAPDARLLAGGTDLLVDLKAGRLSIGHCVSISRVDELRGLSADESGLRIGALTTPNQLAASLLLRGPLAAIRDATRDMAAPQVRNLATVGGNIASAIPSADLPPILIVMNASVILWSPGGERSVPLASFFVGPRQSVRKEHEVLTAIVVPTAPVGFGAAYERFALRAANACAVAGVAASLELDCDGIIQDVRIALCAVAPTPKLVTQAADVLVGQAPGDEVFEEAAAVAVAATDPISDIRGSGEYRRELVGVLTRRALVTASRRAGGEAA